MNLSWKLQAAAACCCFSVIAVHSTDGTRSQGAFLLDQNTRKNRNIFFKSSVALLNAMKAAKQSPSKDVYDNNTDHGKQQQQQQPTKKKIVFVRHSTTYMNEYLGRSLSFGAPHFSDAKFSNDELPLYRDTPLSPRGIQLVQTTLARHRPAFLNKNTDDFDLNLVVVSPLRRALQTFDIGIRPHLISSSSSSKSEYSSIPVVVLPEAAERLYLISDVGTPVDELEKEYAYMDFGEISHDKRHAWWWTPSPPPAPTLNSAATTNNNHNNHNHTGGYVEWRPVGQGQCYACPGEPQADFDARMWRLYTWLEQRPELNIAVVCHHGVIDWMLDMNFDNCQWQVVDFDQIATR
jgi:broad specificity phosphatase PhoE